MNLIYRKVNMDNPQEMQIIAAIDMAIPALFDSTFQVNEKTIKERLDMLMKCKPDDFESFQYFNINGRKYYYKLNYEIKPLCLKIFKKYIRFV